LINDSPLSSIEKLTAKHDVGRFVCNKHSLEQWLRRHALKNQSVDSSQTYVVHRAGQVAGYYALAYSEVKREDSPPNVSNGMPERYAIPVVLLARLAVDDREAGRGLGKALLKDALARAAQAANIAGARAVLVHAIDEDACSFYKHFGFQETPVELHLMLLMSGIREAIGSASPLA